MAGRELTASGKGEALRPRVKSSSVVRWVDRWRGRNKKQEWSANESARAKFRRWTRSGLPPKVVSEMINRERLHDILPIRSRLAAFELV